MATEQLVVGKPASTSQADEAARKWSVSLTGNFKQLGSQKQAQANRKPTDAWD